MTISLPQSIETNMKADKTLLAFLLVPAVIGVINLSSLLTPVKADEVILGTNEQRLVMLTNQERTRAHLPSLDVNPQLQRAAEAKAADMLASDYFAHTSPAGKTPWVFIEQSGYDYEKAGENLAINYTTVEGPIGGWMNSPSHRANILKRDYTEIGIAEVVGEYNGRETTVVVQMFGTPTLTVERLAERVLDTVVSPLPF